MAPDLARAGPVRSSEGVRVTAIPARACSGNLGRVTGIPIQAPDSIEGSGVVLLSDAFRATAIPGDRPLSGDLSHDSFRRVHEPSRRVRVPLGIGSSTTSAARGFA